MFYVYIGCVGAASAALLTCMGYKIMQILQLSSYRMRGVGSWLRATKFEYLVRYASATFFSMIAMLVYLGCFGRNETAAYFGLAFYFLFTVLFVVVTGAQKGVTPLKFTPRILRLCVPLFLLTGAASAGLLYAGQYLRVRYALIGFLPLFVPVFVLLAHGIMLPWETLNNRRYVRKAKRALAARPQLVRIGITGSYGKTTAKNILTAMLARKYKVLTTPGSYNTPLGIAKVVNGTSLDGYDVFVAEMGARYRGDIAALASLVQPNIGILTAVGAQHLQTFGSVDAVAETKYELVRGLAADGTAIFSADNDITRRLYAETETPKILAGENAAAQVRTSDISFSAEGTRFTLEAGEEKAQVATPLLGRHIPSLVSLCAAAALKLDVPFADIVAAAGELTPVEHRLQCVCRGEVTVLDDAYNANAVGAANALEVLSSFAGTHIVITPGLVELGKAEAQANYDLGRQVAAHADYAYFVGSRAADLRAGALQAGMDETHIKICASRDEAVTASASISAPKVILFENDLPDNL